MTSTTTLYVGVTGHRSFDPATAEWVRGALGEAIASLGASSGLAHLVGVTNLAPGADQWFAEAVLGAGGRLAVVLPFDGYEDHLRAGAERAAFQRTLARAATVDTLPAGAPIETAYLLAGQEVVRRCDVLVAVWDGLPARGAGGTASIVAFACAQAKPVVHLDTSARRVLRVDPA
jgi:hypothetical protein